MTHLSSDHCRSAGTRSWLLLLAAAAVSAVGLLAAPEATAQDVPAIVPPASVPLRQLSITISPIHLLLPMLEVTGEYALQPKLGVALIAGYGSMTDATSTIDKMSIMDFGAQVRYYLLGNFEHGMQIGAEVLYTGISATGSSGTTTAQGTGEGLSVGPFVGYKVVSSMGFTFDAQLGAARTGASAEATSSTGEKASNSGSGVGPLLNLNFGWTF